MKSTLANIVKLESTHKGNYKTSEENEKLKSRLKTIESQVTEKYLKQNY